MSDLICERCGQPGAQYDYAGATTAVHDGMLRCIRALQAALSGSQIVEVSSPEPQVERGAVATEKGAGVTPESLRALAEWFDDPANPDVAVRMHNMRYTPGMLLRRIADALEAAAAPQDGAS